MTATLNFLASLQVNDRSNVRRNVSKPYDYLLGRSNSEIARLLQQADLYRPEARQLLEDVNLSAGKSALDLGCGPLGILDEMAKRVGANGTVVGIERENEYRKFASEFLKGAGIRQAEVMSGDARHTDLSADQFDLAHARLLLVNVPSPQDVIAEMARVTKPGGTVALHEVDWISWTCEPFTESWKQIKKSAASVWQQNGLDVNIGRRLPAMLREAGLTDIKIKTRNYVWHAGDLKHRFLLGILNRVRTEITERNILSHEELKRHEDALKEHLSDPGTMILSPTYFQVWGRKML